MEQRHNRGDHRDRADRWADEDEASQAPPIRRLTREEARALAAKEPSVSPWWVVAAQAAAGLLVALLVWGIAGGVEMFWSALYGAAVVVVPGALMARGMTSRLTSVSPGVSAVSFMGWEFVKIGVSVALLMAANRVVVPLSWPALLLGLVVCIKVYWVALLWRRPAKKT